MTYAKKYAIYKKIAYFYGFISYFLFCEVLLYLFIECIKYLLLYSFATF